MKTIKTEDFMASKKVFTLDQAATALGKSGRRRNVLQRLRHYALKGRLKSVARGVYATVPRGQSPETFYPDRYLVAAAVRPDAVFSFHAALELVGSAHSEWMVCTVFTSERRAPLRMGGVTIRFLAHPSPLRRTDNLSLGVRIVDHLGEELKTTGPERTLVEGFRWPGRVGGLNELVESAAGFSVLNLKLLQEVLTAYDRKVLWAAVGWFLERSSQSFGVSREHLLLFREHSPRSAQYLPGARGQGVYVREWNLILPESLARAQEPDELQR